MVFESNMMRVSIDESRALKEYIFRFMNSPLAKKQIIGTAKRAVAQSSINQGDVKGILVPKPSLEEQHLIVKTIEAVDTRLEAAEKTSILLQDIFGNILLQLMTAKIRVREGSSVTLSN
jgi:type I restriction enzyme S subunit